ncbi:MAG: 50S ribosomal protein L15 [Candidatus Melainabacteria bacterium RIFOXYA12_FULL_32_12]|nr:MAG: 50S ribosomal protein L15 [Candidatus Melainabacteria bacterium RIFOXYA2_FULL_32_9]OGI24195.1 MAG: 50S ribosomal protein L15 [Candidatus Melainabacteria bacterium RIFOXYA12_FULL_32_12]
MMLEDLRPADGATHKKKRVGRGRSSGHGKTSTRGHNGEGQRSGRSQKRGFEGGQMPGYRKAPKLKGFETVRPIKYAEINVSQINNLKDDIIDLELLIEKDLYSNMFEALRVLGNGEITRSVTVKARHFTESAKQKIEAAGGKIEVI